MSETIENDSTLEAEKAQAIDVDEEFDRDDLIMKDEICDDGVENTIVTDVLDPDVSPTGETTNQAKCLSNLAFAKGENSKKVGLDLESKSSMQDCQDDCAEEHICFDDNYKVKVARIPRNVLEHMVKFEEDDVVRINVTQLNFFCTSLKRMGKYVLATKWKDSDLPVMKLGVPKNAHKYNTLIVRTFESELNDEEDKRLKDEHKERVQRYMIKKKQSINMSTETNKSTEQADGNIYADPAAIPGVAQILPADGCTNTSAAIQQPTSHMSNNQRRKQIKLLRKKLYKEGQTNAKIDGTTHTNDTPAKQARTERVLKHSNDDYVLRSFPKKNTGSKSKPPNQSKNQQNTKKKLNQGLIIKQSSPVKLNAHNHHDERNRTWKEKSRRPRNEVPILSTSAFGFDRDLPVAPWASGAPAPMKTSEMVQLESLMRRAAYENSSTIATANHIERLGLGSAMGAVLNAVSNRASSVTPSAPSVFPSSVSGIDINSSSTVTDYMRQHGSSPYRTSLENYGYDVDRGNTKRSIKRDREPNDEMDMNKFVEPLDGPCRSNYSREHYENQGYNYGVSSSSVRTQSPSYTKPLLDMGSFSTLPERFNLDIQPSSLVNCFSQDTTYGSNTSHDGSNSYSSTRRHSIYGRDKYHGFGGDYKHARGNGGNRNKFRKSRSGR